MSAVEAVSSLAIAAKRFSENSKSVVPCVVVLALLSLLLYYYSNWISYGQQAGILGIQLQAAIKSAALDKLETNVLGRRALDNFCQKIHWRRTAVQNTRSSYQVLQYRQISRP